jgi:hypothetical protein
MNILNFDFNSIEQYQSFQINEIHSNNNLSHYVIREKLCFLNNESLCSLRKKSIFCKNTPMCLGGKHSPKVSNVSQENINLFNKSIN